MRSDAFGVALQARRTRVSDQILRVQSLSAAYGKHQVLTSIDLSLDRGEWFSLVGPNGSGKSTLIHCVVGQLAPASGNVRVDGSDIYAAPQIAKRRLGYAHPPERLPGLLTGRQCLEIYAAAREQAEFEAEIIQLAQSFRLDGLLDQFVDTYSLGTRQKLSILLALMGDPALVVLDEAFNGLDPRSGHILKRHLQERVGARRCAVFLATHSLDIVLRYSTRVALLQDGQFQRSWNAGELRAMRMGNPDALEVALAQA